MKNRTPTLIVVAGAIVAFAVVVLGAMQGPAFAAADTSPPSVAFTAPSPGAAIRNGQALTAAASDAGGIGSVAFRYCAGTTCTWANGKSIGSATAAPYTVSWSAQPADGSYALLARATDKAGNVATTAAIAVTVDNTAPTTAIVTHPPLVTATASAIFTFSGEAKATFQCSLDGAAFSTCASPKSYAGLTAGWHSFRVRAVDRAGNVDASPETVYWYANVATDTTPPETTITSQPSALTNATGAIFSFSSEAGATFTCSLDNAVYGTCASGKSYSALADGKHTFSVRATDAAGNTDPTPASFTWTVDTSAPDTAIGGHPSSPTNSTTATFTFASEGGASFACKLDSADYASCASPKDLSGLKDGSHTFSVRATDAAGNTDATAATVTWTVDTAAPDTTLDSRPTPLTNAASARFAFSSEADATFGCKLDAADYASCNSPVDLSALEDGDHTFSVQATDAAGNTDATPATFDWTVDTIAPVVSFTDQPADPTNETTAHLDFTSDGNATFECSLDGEVFYTCQPAENVPVAQGDHTFTVRATDPAGNTGSAKVDWTVDTVGPDVAIDGAPRAATSSTDARLVFSSEPQATFECSVDNATFSACGSPVDLSGLAETDHTFAVRATDEAGNTGDTASVHWTVDTTRPTTTIDSGPDPLAAVTGAHFTFSSSEDATFECKLDGADYASCNSPTALSGLEDGSHTFSVRATDAAGNVDGSPAAVTWTSDSAPPAASIISPAADALVSGVVSFGADVSDANGIGGVQFKVDDIALGPEETGSAPYTASWDTTAASNGPHELTVATRDNAGNVTTTSIAVTVSNDQSTTNTPGLISVGPGYVDATARQVVRTSGDRAYIVAVDDSAFQTHTGSAVIRAWKADSAGSPTGFAEVDATNHPRPGASGINNIVGVDLRLDRASGIVHTLRLEGGGSGTLVYQTFDTKTDHWSSTDEDVATGMPAVGRGRGTFALAVDAAGDPHIVYARGGTLYYRERVSGSWTTPFALGTGDDLLHPSMSFDAAGNLHVAWLDDATHTVQYKELHTGGSWDTTDTVATGDVLTNSNADQSVSVAANAEGTPYVLYVSGPRGQFGSSNALFGAVKISYRSADGTWQSDDPAPALLAHTPQLYVQGDDVYAFLGHDINGHLAYAVHQPGLPWSAEKLLSGNTDGFLDGSASVRLDVADANPGLIDSVFYNEDKLHDNSDLPQLYYRAVEPAAPPAPPAPDTTAPSVSIDAPAADTVVKDTVSVTAQAGDDVGVTSVQFQLDGADLGSAEEAAPYSVNWNTTTTDNGPHVLRAIARDAAGHMTTSTAVTVTVQNAAPPEVPITLLGSEGIGWHADNDGAGYAEAFQVVADTPGLLQKLQVYLDAGSAASSVQVGVYSDTGGDRPGILMSRATISLPVTGWNTISVQTLPIAAATTYWIALLAPTGAGQVNFRDAKSGGLAVADSAAGDNLPLTWTTSEGPWKDGPLSAFGTT